MVKIMQKLSEHLSLREATFSMTAERLSIDNAPNEEQLQNMRFWAINVFEPLRRGLGDNPIYISSMFRSEALNKAIGGARTSQHMEGCAADLDNDYRESGPSNTEIFHYVKDNLAFDQLIWEYGDNVNPAWVHVSYDMRGNRKQILRCRRANGKAKYEVWT